MRSPETNSPSLVASNLGTKLGIFTLLAVTCMGMQPGLALAADAELSAAAPVYSVIDDARATTRDWSERLARHVDSWFGNAPFEDGGNVTQGQLNLGVFHRQDQGTDVTVRFSARFRLPNFERSAYLFVGRDNPREAIRDTPGLSDLQQQGLQSKPGDRSFLGGLGGTLGDDVSFRVGVGARLQPFAQVRWDRPWVLSPGQVLALRETLFWSRAERFGATTALTYELELQDPGPGAVQCRQPGGVDCHGLRVRACQSFDSGLHIAQRQGGPGSGHGHVLCVALHEAGGVGTAVGKIAH